MENWQKRKIDRSLKYQTRVFSEHINELVVARRDGKVITLDDGRKMVEFVSCSYLGLETHPTLKKAVIDAIERFGVQVSVARTRVKVDLFPQLEARLNQIMHGAHTLTFNAVTPCHIAVLPLLASGTLPHFTFSKKPYFIMEKTAHATLQINRGLLQQFGDVVRIDFQDTARIEEAFRYAASQGLTPISVSDSVGSMGGVAPVAQIVRLAHQYDGYAYIDDAHGTSIYGDYGSGYVMACLGHRLDERIIIAGSLSKAFGSHGGFIACHAAETINFIKTYGTTYAFGGPPSLPGIAACVAAADLHLDGTVAARQEKLQNVIRYFDEVFGKTEIVNRGTTMPIRGILIGNEDLAITMCKKLHDRGFATTVAMYPTVEEGHAILRCALSALHESGQIDDFYRNFRESLAEATR
ncbi:8-amino-7-oxononanoate synthase family protein [Klebsiella grimontii]|uniref:8-amino-7-oxononanoate synthase family protein n=1 Tax=Klebsiella grimontii TaxID=2058152 RepID=UPI0006696AFA|nr:aminotransferase class I/II-fold pyridoxal phosphate-dependent enzyme [Klebsiella grimontii]QLT65529.1 aminotransferase class I/II-fold pyridoxal phosphate-dependent enzyme [Klebsiella oxytoca]MCS0528556.1 aminotransferase class I/II-fold pyridoxal phosphate-dependent enzyme [Klebsiella grimontii]MCW9527842.1 aminotransferase class I/II-fold pyridoxal phosphate-dependent enzyme [Klebsiella grimontii]MDH0811039.1 aminotransferase class I/II-fold pyridoxal phosphate-dependent enzyme [Klebsiell